MKKRTLIAYLFLFLTCFIFGCATTRTATVTKETGPLFYPSKPEQPRLQYLTSFSSSEDIEGKPTGFRKFVLGESEPAKPIIKPYGVKVYKSKLYVCDTVNNGLEILDLEKKKFEYFNPPGAGQLVDPINLDLSDDGRMFVADSRRGQVVIFDPAGKYLAAIGAKAEFKPTDVDIRQDKVFICDLKTRTIRVHSLSDYSFLYAIPKEGQGSEASLFSPVNVDIDGNGNVYVADAGAFRVNKYDNEGVFLKTFGQHGDSPGQFARPKGLAVDKEGILYVVDAAFQNVQIFNPEGNLLLYFPEQQDKASLTLPAGMCIDYGNVGLFSQFIDKDFKVKYLVFVVSQYGDRKVGVFGFGGREK